MCSKHLKAALPEWLPYFEGERRALPAEVRAKVLSISPAQIDRLLRAPGGHGVVAAQGPGPEH